MKTLLAMCAAIAAGASGAATVSGISVSQDPATRVVTVGYTLDVPAIVTVDFIDDGTPIPAERSTTLAGAVNRRVGAGAQVIRWFPDRDWPGHSIASGKLSARITAWSLDVPPDYMVIDLRVTRTANRDNISYYASSNAIPGGIGDRIYKTDKLVMRRIPAAGVTWRMGAEPGKWLSEADNPFHYVSFTDDYYMGVYEVTMGQYHRICGYYPTKAMDGFDPSLIEDRDCHPASGISYNQSNGDGAYLRDDSWPSSKIWTLSHFPANGLIAKLYACSGIKFDIPTDAEWEYACRATTDNTLNTPGNEGHVSTSTDSVCPYTEVVSWYSQNSGGVTHPVGLKTPNTWGLYDMHGNVCEWCLDRMGNLSATTDPVSNPGGATSGTQRIRRGGCFSHAPLYHRSSCRQGANPSGNYVYNGVRLRCPVQVAE